MTNAIVTVSNVHSYIDANGTAWLNAEDVARGLGFTTVATSGNECVRWARVNGYLAEFGYSKAVGKEDFIHEILNLVNQFKALISLIVNSI